MRRRTTPAIAAVCLAGGRSLLLGCASALKPLPDGPPPVYEAPRPFEPKRDVDHVPGEVTWTPTPANPPQPSAKEK